MQMRRPPDTIGKVPPRIAPICAALLLCGCISVSKRNARLPLVREAVDFIQEHLDGCDRMVEMSHIRDEAEHRARCYANAARIIKGQLG